MTLEIRLPAETEARIRDLAAASGQDVEAFVLNVLADKLAHAGPVARPSGNGADWAEKLRACIALHPVVHHFVEDSRESIHAGRGE